MLDTMHYYVNEDGQSCFQVCVEDFGIEMDVTATINHPNVAEWELNEVQAFQNDVNLLLLQAREDFQRLVQSVSRNYQLEAAGLPAEHPDEPTDEDLEVDDD